jgi:4-hydroxy-2-oxoheptanedioate aldolase
MVDTAEQAARIVRAARYPQADGQGGIRGMGGARASAWGRRANYANEANAQVCVLVQVETRQALAHLDAIAATEGVDGVFIGPADLSASMGHIGNPGHPEVQEAIADAIARIRRAGKATGILTPNEALARKYLELGCTFTAVGLDTSLLVQATSALAARFKQAAAPAPKSQTY